METHTEQYNVAKSYLDMARAVIDTQLHRPRHGSTNDAVFGLASCTYTYSYMAITAFVSGQLYTCWSRKDSDLGKKYPQYHNFTDFMFKEFREIKEALKQLCDELKIKKHHETSPETWQKLNEFLKNYRDYFVHPTPEDFGSIMEKIVSTPWNFASNTAVAVVGHYYDELKKERPEWLKKGALVIPRIRVDVEETNSMEALKILESKRDLNWDYDGEADVLYLSVASPKPAVGIDIGEGVIVRYDEGRSQVVGLSIVGLREKMLRELSSHTR